jgi:hypothetical protein
MRLSKVLLADRLRRVRARAYAARTTLAAVRRHQRELPAFQERPPLPSRSELLCGRRCETENAMSPGRRGSARVAADWTIVLRGLGRTSLDVRLTDISTGGCQVEASGALNDGDHLVARLPGLEPLGAKVAWTDRCSAGLRFDRPLHPAVFELLLTRIA